MTPESIIEYIGTPIGIAVVLGYGMYRMYKHFKQESSEQKEIIQKKDLLIEQLNEKHVEKIEELVANNIEVNTLVNESVKNQNENIKNQNEIIKSIAEYIAKQYPARH